jgi:hypothetical protein
MAFRGYKAKCIFDIENGLKVVNYAKIDLIFMYLWLNLKISQFLHLILKREG